MSFFPPAGDNEGLLPPKAGGGGGGAWGGITGTLSSQTDLQAALDAKVDLTGDTMTGPLITAASASGGSGFRLPPGADPSAPVDGDVWSVALGMKARVNGSTKFFAFTNTTATWLSKQTFTASTSGGAFFNLAHGTAPSAPVDGDIWTETAGVYAQVNGVTKQLDAAGGGGNPALAWVI